MTPDYWYGPWHMGWAGGAPRESSALRILEERFARGDIQKPEYDEKKAVLLSERRP